MRGQPQPLTEREGLERLAVIRPQAIKQEKRGRAQQQLPCQISDFLGQFERLEIQKRKIMLQGIVKSVYVSRRAA